MSQLDKLEMTLDEMLNKKAPVKIPPDGRRSIAHAMWWVALIIGLIQLWVAWNLWHLGHLADRGIDYLNSLSSYYGTGEVASHLGLMYYLALLVIAVDAVILLLAAPGLKAMRKAGWNLLFYSVLLNLVYGVVALFMYYGGLSTLLGTIVGSVVGAYLIFQVREFFMKSAPADHKAEAKKA